MRNNLIKNSMLFRSIKLQTRYVLIPILLILLIKPLYPEYETFVITSEMIKNSGLTRTGEILFLINGWHIYSIDGYTWNANPNYLSPDYKQKWAVFIDGQKIDITVFNTQNLNQLPLSINQIDYIEVVNHPQLYLGVFADYGLLHIHTIKPDSGMTYHGRFTYGNETGDPGPYRYTKFTSPNIDRIAADQSSSLYYKCNYLTFGLNYSDQVYYPTDPALYPRNSSIAGNYHPRINMSSLALKANYQNTVHKHHLFVSQSRMEDFFFFKAFGREIPVENVMMHTGLDGLFSLNEKIRFHYYIKYSRTKLSKRENKLQLDFNWKMRQFYLNTEAQYHTKSLAYKLGIGMKNNTIITKYATKNIKFYNNKFYAEISYKVSEKMKQNINTTVIYNKNKERVFKYAISNTWQPTNAQQLLLSISYSQQYPGESMGYIAQAIQGYSFLNDYVLAGSLQSCKKLTIDLSWKFRIKEALSIYNSFLFRNFITQHLEIQHFQYNYSDKSCYSPITVYGNNHGKIVGWNIKIDHHVSQKIVQSLYYVFQNNTGGDSIFTELWQSNPTHKLHYSLTFLPKKGFTIYTGANFISSTNWSEYRGIRNESSGKYRESIPAMFTVDIAVQKWFWQYKLRGMILIRNITNQNEKYHPIGAVSNLRFHIQGELYLNSIL